MLGQWQDMSYATLYLLSSHISEVVTGEAEQVEHDRWVLISIARGPTMSAACHTFTVPGVCVWASSCLSASAAPSISAGLLGGFPVKLAGCVFGPAQLVHLAMLL